MIFRAIQDADSFSIAQPPDPGAPHRKQRLSGNSVCHWRPVRDIAISVDSARFSLTETRIGLTPANISPYLIARLGVSNARKILINAHFFNAEEGLRLGLLYKTVPPGELDGAIDDELKSCLACPPGAIAMTKELIRNVILQPPEQNQQYTARMLADAWKTDEAQAGIGGFFNKQPPPWAE